MSAIPEILTEAEIRAVVDRWMRLLDGLLLLGAMPARDYELAVKDIDLWAMQKECETIIARCKARASR